MGYGWSKSFANAVAYQDAYDIYGKGDFSRSVRPKRCRRVRLRSMATPAFASATGQCDNNASDAH